MDVSVNHELLSQREKTNREKNIFGRKEYVVIVFLLTVVAGATIVIVVIVTNLSQGNNNSDSHGATCPPKLDYMRKWHNNDTWIDTVYEILLQSFCDSSKKSEKSKEGGGIGDLNGTYFSLSYLQH